MMAVGAGAMMTVGGAEMTVETMEETTTSSVLRIMPMSVCVCVLLCCTRFCAVWHGSLFSSEHWQLCLFTRTHCHTSCTHKITCSPRNFPSPEHLWHFLQLARLQPRRLPMPVDITSGNNAESWVPCEMVS